MGVIQLAGRGGQYWAIVDDEDLDYLSVFNWRALVQGNESTRRVYAVHPKIGRMHRLIWARMHGSISAEVEVDHIEPGVLGGLDNRRCNLRLSNKSLNQANSRKPRNNTSGYKGVWWHRSARMWRVDLWIERRKWHVGYFSDKVEAARAYDSAARLAFGAHARLNFPDGRAA